MEQLMYDQKILGIDLGGTHVRVGIVEESEVNQVLASRIPSQGTIEEVLDEIFRLCDPLINSNIKAIGIGVPSVVDVEKGLVYDVQNIPSWKEVPLKALMEKRYRLPVFINNDANCFALGEKHFGKGQKSVSMVGLTIGTGLGAGIIIDHRLYAGKNCGAGEFGMVDYLDECYEYYASGQFFKNKHQIDGEYAFKRAKAGQSEALQIFEELGTHLGNAVKMIMYTYDPELIILGGSIRAAYPYFQKSMWQRINTFAYRKSLETFRVEMSELKNCAVLGAAALYYNAQN